MLVSLRTPRGESIDLTLREDVNIADLKKVLISEFGYVRSVQIMYGTRIVKNDSYVDEYPMGSLIVVGHRVAEQPQRREPDIPIARHQTQGYSTDRYAPHSTTAAPHHHAAPASSPYSLRNQQQPASGGAHYRPQQASTHSSHPYSPGSSSGGSASNSSTSRRGVDDYARERQHQYQPSPTATHHHQQQYQDQRHHQQHATPQQHREQHPYASHTGAGTPQHHREESTPSRAGEQHEADESVVTTVTVRAIIPALNNRVVEITLPDDLPVRELLKRIAQEEPSTAGCKILFFGKYVTDTAQACKAVPLKDQAEIMVASGPFLNDKVMTLYLADRSIKEVQGYIAAAGGVKAAPKGQRNYWNEILMKSLSSLDLMVGLEGDLRTQRKEYVKTISALLDSLDF